MKKSSRMFPVGDGSLARVLFLVGATLAGGCANVLGTAAVRDGATADARSAWGAAIEGRNQDAAAAFRAQISRRSSDVWALFGEATLAFERGDSARAVSSYLSLIERSAAPDEEMRAAPQALAAMAVGRLAGLLEEFGGSESGRRSIEDRLTAVPLTHLSWEARYGLAMIADRAARRRGDVPLLARAAQSAGCVRTFTVAPPAGILPHLDLDTRVSAPAQARGDRVVQAVGCVVAVPTFDGRAGAQRLLAELDVPSGGAYSIVLDFRGEARIVVDGASQEHGGEHIYGPRVSAAGFQLTPGHHKLEIRLAMFGGHPELAVMIIPGEHEYECCTVVHPPPPATDPIVVAGQFAATYVANRRGDANQAWRGSQLLMKTPRFAPGLALAAAVALDDPSRPVNFARDDARTLLKAAANLDPALARVRHALAGIALDDDRPREAIDEAQAAADAAPGWWPPSLTLYAAYRQRGLTWDADQALDRALTQGAGACSVVEIALGRSEDRRDVDDEKRLGAKLDVCGKDADAQIERLRRTGDLDGAESALRRVMALGPDRDDAKSNLASVLVTRGRAAEAAPLIAATIEPRDGEGQVRLADALIAAGARDKARDVIARALAAHPELPEIMRAARALGLPLPLDAFRLDGAQVIRDFEASKRHYAAPAVVVLDRTVTRIFPSGAEMVLTHEIVRVQSKDAIQKWGETAVPERTEILVLRTHKADGTTREPEELAGKETISAADLAIGDYVEKETIETRSPRDAFVAPSAPEPDGGFLGERFYFQSFDAPLDRSEYLLVTTPDAAQRMRFDRRAGAPEPVRTQVASATATASDPLTVTTFAAAQVPQLFAERSSVPSIEYVPSVRASVGIGWQAWTRFLREQLYGTLRDAPGLERAAGEIRAQSPDASPRSLAAALVTWVGQNIEADDDLRDSASLSIARGRGNRLAVILALARVLRIDARPVLARSLLTADGQAPTTLEEADDFADPLVRIECPGHDVFFVDPRLKHAPLGYLPPGLDGARVLSLNGGSFEIAHSRGDEHRAVDIAVHLDAQGGGAAEVVETVRGWPALEWAEIVDRFGSDASKLRQDFEQRWLGVQFPGAVLKDLRIEILGQGSKDGGGQKATPEHETTRATAPRAPYAAAAARLTYSFSSARLALKRDREIRFLPTFFRSQPGRRYATEAHRMTALLTGFDIPLDLQARVDLPAGARLVDGPRARPSTPAAEVAGQAGYRFWEDRRLDPSGKAADVLVIRRQARLPIMRVPLRDYPALAAELRRVDAQEQEEVRIGIAPEHR